MLLISFNGFTQVELFITKTDGDVLLGTFVEKSLDSLTVTSNKKTMTFSFSAISKIQTMGVHFLQDAYNKELSQNSVILEYDNLGSFEGWGIYLSARPVESNVIILFKFKWLVHNAEVPFWNVITDNDTLILNTVDGSKINLKLTNSYILKGYEFYNFGFLILQESEITHLINSPVKSIIYRGENCRIKDEYAIMRQLLAIFDDGIKWRYL